MKDMTHEEILKNPKAEEKKIEKLTAVETVINKIGTDRAKDATLTIAGAWLLEDKINEIIDKINEK